MLPGDANPHGNVHGGTILKMIDQAGYICTTKYANRHSSTSSFGVIARIEHMDFCQPMYIGEVAIVEASLTYTSDYSLEVLVDVYAENIATLKRRLTNRATAWYVNLSKSDDEQPRFHPAKVPPLRMSDEAYAAGKIRYEAQKQERANQHESLNEVMDFEGEEDVTKMSQLMLPDDCNSLNIVRGGVIMKLIDNCAAVGAARHCRTNVVTGAVDALNFTERIHLGNLVHVAAVPTFASRRSLELAVTVEGEDVSTGRRYRSAEARLTFVSLDEEGKTREMPPVRIAEDDNSSSGAIKRKRFHDAQRRYEERKAQRARGRGK